MKKTKQAVSYTAVCVMCGKLLTDGEGVVKERKYYCENCAVTGTPEQQDLSTPTGALKILCYIASLIPLVGFIFGAIFYSQKSRPARQFGRNCFIMMAVGICISLLFMFVMAGAGAMIGGIAENINFRESYF
ncbi:MAG: hypothetical protein LLG37_04825 [Spirochaetia bacterium]|nr:hypothetical protein [Spirochaetia bacterium]